MIFVVPHSTAGNVPPNFGLIPQSFRPTSMVSCGLLKVP